MPAEPGCRRSRPDPGLAGGSGPAWPHECGGGPERRHGRSGGPAWPRACTSLAPLHPADPARFSPLHPPSGRLVSLAVLTAFLLGVLWLASALHVSAAGEQLPAGEGLRGGEQLHLVIGDFFSFFPYFSEI